MLSISHSFRFCPGFRRSVLAFAITGAALMRPVEGAAQTAVGSTSGTQTATVAITAAGTLTSINVLTQGAPNKDFKELSPDGGTCAALVGRSVSAGLMCTVQYTFTPTRPGQRLGASC